MINIYILAEPARSRLAQNPMLCVRTLIDLRIMSEILIEAFVNHNFSTFGFFEYAYQIIYVLKLEIRQIQFKII